MIFVNNKRAELRWFLSLSIAIVILNVTIMSLNITIGTPQGILNY